MKETTWLVDEDGHKQREAEPFGLAGPGYGRGGSVKPFGNGEQSID